MDQRPSPEAMLARAASEAAKQQRGRLKIFFGMAPGVGKTYALLCSARQLAASGTDVLVGWVETHGRRETAALLAGLPVLPPRRSDYRGLVQEEFDIEEALRRRPGLVLLDELAHTNAAGSRHAKRWEDAEELRQAGIDVYTTLNVQHVESLNDLVAALTGVTVRETVPDAVFDSADDIELIDLPPDDLLTRLEQGKVYGREQAALARDRFFKKSNLLALRELALRRTAERVDAQRDEHRRLSGQSHPSSMRERLLVAVGPAPSSARVVRAAARLAYRLRAPWLAVSVETPALANLAEQARQQLASNLALAQKLGAETLTIVGNELEQELLALGRQRRITRLVVGRPLESKRWPWRRRSRSLLDRLLELQPEFDVLVTSGIEAPAEVRLDPPRRRFDWLAVVWAILVVAVLVGLGWLLQERITVADQAMLLLLGVIGIAARLTRSATVVATCLSVLSLDFFFVPPRFHLWVDDQRYLVTFAVMFLVALVAANFTNRFRAQATASQARERATATLFAMSRQFVVETGLGAIAGVAVGHLKELLGVEAQLWIADSQGELKRGNSGPHATISESDLGIAQWAFKNGKLAGHGTSTLPASGWLFVPLVGSAGHLGAVGLQLGQRPSPPTPSQWQVAETFIAQAALAVERALLAERAALTKLSNERERTRNTLLAAVSHDIRTPLATIVGAASTVLAKPELARAEQSSLLTGIHGEAERLSRLVSHLLDLTRLQSEEFELVTEPYPLEELVQSALDRLAGPLSARPVAFTHPEAVLSVRADGLLIEQALLNLLENALKFSPPESPITIELSAQGQWARIELSDRGPGLPPDQVERVFERFFRLEDGQRAGGAGLGLALVRTIVHLHGGRVSALNRPEGGASFRIELPLDVERSAPNARSIP